MNKTIIARTIGGILVSLWFVPAFGLMMESELSGPDLGQLSDWVRGLEKLVSYGGVVYGVHMDAPTFYRGLETMYIFFRGDHEDFNEMLKEYAKLGDSLKPYVAWPSRSKNDGAPMIAGAPDAASRAPAARESKEVQLTLTLHAGRGNVGSDAGRTIAKAKNIPFDWKVTMTREGTLVPDREKRRYFVSVDLWVGGDVELDKVEVPLNIDVKSGGEIEDFIAKHEEKRKQAQKSQQFDGVIATLRSGKGEEKAEAIEILKGRG